MILSFSQIIIFYCIYKFSGERTIFAIYHLLHGKKSSQTIQDAHLFQLTKLFQTDTTITRSFIEDTIMELERQQLIIETSKQHFVTTNKGVDFLHRALEERPIPVHINGWKYQREADLFWEKLSLTVQVISYLQRHESKYIPVQRNPETILWMRNFLQTNQWSRDSLGKQLYTELVSILEKDSTMDPIVFVLRLSGYQSTGLTAQQAAKEVKMELTEYHYQFLNILHFIMQYLENNKVEFPLLSLLFTPSKKNNLTQSTEKTLQLLNQGFNLSHIMRVRNLKQSTVEDHIVELALHMGDFPIDEYVSLEKQKEIRRTAKEMNTKQLKQIRSVINDCNYFEIRLVLAKYGDQL